MKSTMRRGLRTAVSLTAAAALMLFGTGIASAHVTVNPDNAAPGSWTKLTFRVPTESDTASTTRLEVTLPADQPFASVSVMPIPGWTAELEMTQFPEPVTQGAFNLTEAVTKVSWTADDEVGVKPGEFMEFPMSVGPVPDVPQMLFPADQFYSDGTVVSWVDERSADAAEPDYPAPLLVVSSDTAGAVSSGTDASDGSEIEVTADATTSGSDNTARVLALAGLIIAALALLTAAIGLRRRGETSS